MTLPLSDPRDRRHAARRVPGELEPLARFRLRGGREVAVVDLSASGALVEGDVRLLPGTHVDVHVVTVHGRVLVRSRVMRAFVSAVCSERVSYRSALAFDRHIDVAAGYPIPTPHTSDTSTLGNSYPGSRS